MKDGWSRPCHNNNRNCKRKEPKLEYHVNTEFGAQRNSGSKGAKKRQWQQKEKGRGPTYGKIMNMPCHYHSLKDGPSTTHTNRQKAG